MQPNIKYQYLPVGLINYLTAKVPFDDRVNHKVSGLFIDVFAVNPFFNFFK